VQITIQLLGKELITFLLIREQEIVSDLSSIHLATTVEPEAEDEEYEEDSAKLVRPRPRIGF
jgi:hypothetical protein